jgi:hypothetical protein
LRGFWNLFLRAPLFVLNARCFMPDRLGLADMDRRSFMERLRTFRGKPTEDPIFVQLGTTFLTRFRTEPDGVTFGDVLNLIAQALTKDEVKQRNYLTAFIQWRFNDLPETAKPRFLPLLKRLSGEQQYIPTERPVERKARRRGLLERLFKW